VITAEFETTPTNELMLVQMGDRDFWLICNQKADLTVQK
tara:strand:- start:639 stop:755 length:117 start_codon:yes stop_codon:yes gene_type:complete